jgi:molecular chaperone GrpE
MTKHRDAAAETAGGEGTQNGAGEVQKEEFSAEQLRAQLDEERARAESYLGQWQRAAADFQNFKRRTEQEREEYGRLASTAFIINILPAIDDLDRAMANVDGAIAGTSWVEGIGAIQRKLKGALEAAGLTEIPAEGEKFDPNVHEAISQAPGAHDAVVAEVRKGYRLGNRVIRPAMVVVGNGETA